MPTKLPAQDLYVGPVKIFKADGTIETPVAVAAGTLAASTAGRAMMATGYFDLATVKAKFGTDSFDNAALIQLIADGAFNADAATRALFDDGIWTRAKLAAGVLTYILSYQVEDLAAGGDITDRVIFSAPTGIDATLVSASIIPQGDDAGIDDTNTCVIKLSDGTNTIVEKTYNTGTAFPNAGAEGSLGTLAADYKGLAQGEKLYLSVTNGTLANPPAFMLQVVYTIADHA